MRNKAIVSDVIAQAPSRRKMIRTLTAATTVASLTGSSNLSADPATPTPEDVVQFALNLEYLEAEFYSVATTGQTLEERGYDFWGQGQKGPTKTRYGKVDFSDRVFRTSLIAREIGTDELGHVKLLREALYSNGFTPIAKPAIDLDALAAKGASLENERTFLVLSRIFEDVGVSAYSGGAQFLSNSPYLRTAARIAAVEGEHVANVRLQIAHLGIPTSALDGADVLPPPTGWDWFSTNLANGLCAYRTPGEVLYLAYGKADATWGGFFPSGVNGVLRRSTGPATAANLEP